MKKLSKEEFRLFWRFVKFLLPYRSKWLAILTLSGLGMLFSLVNPYLVKLVVDKAIGGRDTRILIILVLAGGGVFALGSAVSGLQRFLSNSIELRLSFDLHKKVFKHLQQFSFRWFQDKSTGEHIYKVSSDIERVLNFITTIPPQAVSLFPRLLFTFIIVFYLNQTMAVLSLCLIPFLFLSTVYFSRLMRKTWKNLFENFEDIFKTLGELFSHVQLVKVFGKETVSIRNYLRKLIGSIRIRTKSIKLEIFSSFSAQIIGKMGMGLIVFYGGYQVIKGKMSLGSLTAIMIYLSQLVGLQGSLSHFFQTAAVGLVSCRRVADILDQKPQIIENKQAKKITFKGAEIVFKGVSFGYRPKEYIVKNLNFHIEDGKHIALAGPSGCGKTTVVYLLLRLYELWDGEIFIDGHNIRSIKERSLKNQISIALQEPFLWNDSIENNIKYGKENAVYEEMLKVAQLTEVDEFVKNLPQGYKTLIGEAACKLSEGQKQKIALARALIKTPKILILDEAMSSMDSYSEERIIAKIKELPISTVITISHRLSTVMSADLVYFLAEPDKIEIGTGQSLLKNNKDFYNLFASQVRGEGINIKNQTSKCKIKM